MRKPLALALPERDVEQRCQTSQRSKERHQTIDAFPESEEIDAATANPGSEKRCEELPPSLKLYLGVDRDELYDPPPFPPLK